MPPIPARQAIRVDLVPTRRAVTYDAKTEYVFAPKVADAAGQVTELLTQLARFDYDEINIVLRRVQLQEAG